MDITKPLMRGIKLTVEDEGREKGTWCPFEYEFLPDICYICGIIGHVAKVCEDGREKGVAKQYNAKLRYVLEKKKSFDGSYGRGSMSRSSTMWRSGGSGSRGSGSGGGDLGSDALRWRCQR